MKLHCDRHCPKRWKGESWSSLKDYTSGRKIQTTSVYACLCIRECPPSGWTDLSRTQAWQVRVQMKAAPPFLFGWETLCRTQCEQLCVMAPGESLWELKVCFSRYWQSCIFLMFPWASSEWIDLQGTSVTLTKVPSWEKQGYEQFNLPLATGKLKQEGENTNIFFSAYLHC